MDIDVTAIRASALRIMDLAREIRTQRRRDFEVEALAILTLIRAEPTTKKRTEGDEG